MSAWSVVTQGETDGAHQCLWWNIKSFLVVFFTRVKDNLDEHTLESSKGKITSAIRYARGSSGWSYTSPAARFSRSWWGRPERMTIRGKCEQENDCDRGKEKCRSESVARKQETTRSRDVTLLVESKSMSLCTVYQ